MWARLIQAVTEGILWGVKLAAMGLIVWFALSWLVGDYQATRDRARRGQEAYEFLLQQQARPAPPAPITPRP